MEFQKSFGKDVAPHEEGRNLASSDDFKAEVQAVVDDVLAEARETHPEIAAAHDQHRRAAESVLGEAVEPEPRMRVVSRASADVLLVAPDAYDLYMDVEEFGADRAALVEHLGGEAKARVAALIHAEVRRQIQRHHDTSDRPLVIVEEGWTPPAQRVATKKRPPKLSEAEAREQAEAIAAEMRVDFAAVAAKQQGTRSEKHDEIKQARRKIARALSRRGATYAVIGGVLGGRNPEAVRVLIEAATQDDLARYAAALAARDEQQKGGGRA